MQRTARITTACLLVLFLGLHWALLQSVAWTAMIINYSEQASLKVAVSRTFDGQHPCPLCKEIQKGKAAERHQSEQQLNPSQKLDLAVIWEGTDFICSSATDFFQPHIGCCPSRQEAPPTPPPRQA